MSQPTQKPTNQGEIREFMSANNPHSQSQSANNNEKAIWKLGFEYAGSALAWWEHERAQLAVGGLFGRIGEWEEWYEKELAFDDSWEIQRVVGKIIVVVAALVPQSHAEWHAGAEVASAV